MAMIAFAFLAAVANVDTDKILIRNKNVAREDYDFAWTIKVMASVGLTAAKFAVAPLCAVYFNDGRAETVVQIILRRALFLGFENTGSVYFRRNLNFSREF